ncbi:hypothetical protein GH714_029268 [Hevea brasiliensis]|uniref:Integrase catalytic domain-containing protein n=1 Tax=Hevea brasiliensis TaxID=3981 RepID=A0A6A6N4P3_HEVBR|nr:hypothetical protein GH714_029268 [Hevea brasiliensis]
MHQHKEERVIVIANNLAYLVAKGVVKISMDDKSMVKLNDVFHVPGLKRNLVSVSQITNSGKYVLFGPKDVKVLDNVKAIYADVVTFGERKGCQFGKSHRLPFTKSSNHRSSMLELVHTDLMGPTKTPSYSGYRYVMVLVDDFSRYTWVKFLKEKSEALSKFAEFRDAVEKEFGKKIKYLWSDNGGEYMSKDFF